MKILYLSACSQLGGAERALLDTLASIRAANSHLSLHLVTTEDGPLISECRALNVEATVVQLPKRVARLGDAAPMQNRMWHLFATAPSVIAYLFRLRRVIRSFAPDVIHTNGFKVHVLGAFATPRASALVWHIHDFVSSRPVMAKLLRLLSRFCDVAVANSGAVAADFHAVCGERLEVKTVYNAVHLQRFSARGAADLDELSGMRPPVAGTIRIGLVATLARWKGHETFLRALSLVPRELPIRGYIIGDAIYQTDASQYSIDELRSLAHELGVIDRVGFTGFINDSAAAMRALDVVVHASTRREPFGLVIAEAAACGKAIIAAEKAGATELLRDRIDFVSHEAGDSLSLAAQIVHLAADAALRSRMAAKARATAERCFDRMRLGAELFAIYSSLSTVTAQDEQSAIGELCPLTSDV